MEIGGLIPRIQYLWAFIEVILRGKRITWMLGHTKKEKSLPTPKVKGTLEIGKRENKFYSQGKKLRSRFIRNSQYAAEICHVELNSR